MKVTTREVKFRDPNGRMVSSLVIGNGSLHDEVADYLDSSTAIEDAVASATGEWLTENITQPTTPVVDASLLVSGAAADSKKVGDEISALKSYVTPQMYGAKGDGVADDTTAINQAIQASKYVLFPYGTYKTTGTILINKEIKIDQYGVINYTGSDSAVKITGSIANRTDLYFADIEALNGNGIEFYSSYFRSTEDNDRIMYLNLYFGTIRAKEKCIYFHRGNNGEPMTDGFMNEIHIYNGKFGGDAEYGIYADSGNYSAINNVKLINVSLEGVKTGIYLKDNIYRWSFINLRYAEAPTYYHIQTVGVVSDIMWFGTNKLYENYIDFSNETSGLLISPMAKNANYYMARINNGILEYIDPLINNAVQVSGADSAKFNFASSNGRLQWSMDGNFTINGTAYTRLMMFLGTDGNLGLSAYNGSWTALVKSKIDGHVLLGTDVDSADVAWATANSRFAQTLDGAFTVNDVTYSKIMFYLGADGQIGLSGHNGSSWVALCKGTIVDGAQLDNRISSIETEVESISEGLVTTEYIKILDKKSSAPVTDANSTNFMPPGTVFPSGYKYRVKISIDTPTTASSKIYWRSSTAGNVTELCVVPAGSTYYEVMGSPSVEANGFRINSPTLGAYYTFVVEQEVKRPVLDDINSRLDSLETNSFNHVDALGYKDKIPSYWFEKSTTPSTYEEANTYLDGILETVPDGKHFIFVTDTHWPKNAQHGNQIIQYVRGRLGVDKVIFGGDILNANDTKYLAKSVMSEYLNECVAAYGTSFLPVWGNHDLNTANDSTAGRLDLDVVSDLFVKHLNGVVQFEDYHNYGGMTGPTVDVITAIVDNKIEADPSITTTLGKTRGQIINDLLKYNKLHYYYDDHKNKIRYIVYNTGCPLNNIVSTFLGVQHNPEGYLQTFWMRDVLLSTPSGYDVIAVAHESVYSGDEHPDDMASSFYMKNMMAMMSALKRKISINVWIDTSLASLIPTEWMPTGSVQCDFRNAPDVGKVILLCGHWHRDLAGIGSYGSSTGINDFKVPLVEDLTFSSPISVNQSELGEIPVVLTRCDKCWADNDTVDIRGTTNEHSFDIVTLTDSDVVFTRVGWAISGTRQRIFTFSDKGSDSGGGGTSDVTGIGVADKMILKG